MSVDVPVPRGRWMSWWSVPGRRGWRPPGQPSRPDCAHWYWRPGPGRRVRPDHYDSLRLFSPARFSALLGLPMPGPVGRFPTRDEMTLYLRAYADRFALPVRTRTRVTSLTRDGSSFA